MIALDPLARPIWSSLTTTHAGHAVGGPRALRFRPGITRMGGAADTGPESLEALGALVRQFGPMIVAEEETIPVPDGTRMEIHGEVQQMHLRDTPPEPDPGVEVVSLDASDAEEMLALARLTNPGPFEAEAWRLGDFLGVRREGVLVAMAGERFRQPGHREISGVCTHPDHQGQGLSRRLCAHQVQRILARGERPYLHVYDTNAAAIAVYERLGFVTRRKLVVMEVHPD